MLWATTSDDRLLEVDVNAQSATQVFMFPESTRAIATEPGTGILYWVGEAQGQRVYTFDPMSMTNTDVGGSMNGELVGRATFFDPTHLALMTVGSSTMRSYETTDPMFPMNPEDHGTFANLGTEGDMEVLAGGTYLVVVGDERLISLVDISVEPPQVQGSEEAGGDPTDTLLTGVAATGQEVWVSDQGGSIFQLTGSVANGFTLTAQFESDEPFTDLASGCQ
jgi:hypothetical protein